MNERQAGDSKGLHMERGYTEVERYENDMAAATDLQAPFFLLLLE